MMVGSFGDIVFRTFWGEVQTFDNLKIKQAAEYAEHKVINEKPKLEYTGMSLKEITMDVKLSSTLGLDPNKTVALFREYIENGDVYPLVIGGNFLGEYVMQASDEAWKTITLLGFVREINLNLTFKEYN